MASTLYKGRQLLRLNDFDSKLTSLDDRGRRLRSDKTSQEPVRQHANRGWAVTWVGRVQVTFTLFRTRLAWGRHNWLHTHLDYREKLIWCFSLLRNGRDRVPYCSWRSMLLLIQLLSFSEVTYPGGNQDLTLVGCGFSPGCVFALLDWFLLVARSKEAR